MLKLRNTLIAVGTFITFFITTSIVLGLSNVSTPAELTVRSTAFNNEGQISLKYVCTRIPGGENVSLPLEWSAGPQGTKSYAILMYDLSPVANNHVHWAVTNIPSRVTSFKEGISRTQFIPAGTLELSNTSGQVGYEGPCPPQGTGSHKYRIVVVALNTNNLDISGSVSVDKFEAMVKDKVLAQGEIAGYYPSLY